MELKLVYRTLRQISDWALRYYSEVYVDGQENIPADGPLILCVYPPRMTSSTCIPPSWQTSPASTYRLYGGMSG